MKRWRCVHGLDLRKNARCYLCEPEVDRPATPISVPFVSGGATKIVSGGTTNVRCTCGSNYAGTCPIHDVTITYTNHDSYISELREGAWHD